MEVVAMLHPAHTWAGRVRSGTFRSLRRSKLPTHAHYNTWSCSHRKPTWPPACPSPAIKHGRQHAPNLLAKFRHHRFIAVVIIFKVINLTCQGEGTYKACTSLYILVGYRCLSTYMYIVSKQFQVLTFVYHYVDFYILIKLCA